MTLRRRWANELLRGRSVTTRSGPAPPGVEPVPGRLELSRRLAEQSSHVGVTVLGTGDVRPDLEQGRLPGRTLPHRLGRLRPREIPAGLGQVADVGAGAGGGHGEHDDAERAPVL